jgi:hypothetical protein
VLDRIKQLPKGVMLDDPLLRELATREG